MTSCVLCFRNSHKAALKVSAGAVVSSEGLAGEICFQAHSCSCWLGSVSPGLFVHHKLLVKVLPYSLLNGALHRASHNRVSMLKGKRGFQQETERES